MGGSGNVTIQSGRGVLDIAETDQIQQGMLVHGLTWLARLNPAPLYWWVGQLRFSFALVFELRGKPLRD